MSLGISTAPPPPPPHCALLKMGLTNNGVLTRVGVLLAAVYHLTQVSGRGPPRPPVHVLHIPPSCGESEREDQSLMNHCVTEPKLRASKIDIYEPPSKLGTSNTITLYSVICVTRYIPNRKTHISKS